MSLCPTPAPRQPGTTATARLRGHRGREAPSPGEAPPPACRSPRAPPPRRPQAASSWTSSCLWTSPPSLSCASSSYAWRVSEAKREGHPTSLAPPSPHTVTSDMETECARYGAHVRVDGELTRPSWPRPEHRGQRARTRHGGPAAPEGTRARRRRGRPHEPAHGRGTPGCPDTHGPCTRGSATRP